MRVVDYGGTDESQNRGSLHTHLEIWIERKFTDLGDPRTIQELKDLATKIASCRKEDLPPGQDHIQTHKCGPGYKKQKCLKPIGKGKNAVQLCGYRFPLPPLDEHLVSESYVDRHAEEFKEHQQQYLAILLMFACKRN